MDLPAIAGFVLMPAWMAWLGANAATLTALAAYVIKPWRWVRAYQEAQEDRMREIATGVATDVADAVWDRLQSPNGGKSLADLARKVDRIDVRTASTVERVGRLEDRVDTIIIPRQKSVHDALIRPE